MLSLLFQSKLKCSWYVDSVSGNNANTGRSPAQAFQTIATAMAACSAGQTIGLARGSTFTETVTIPANNIKLRAYGSGATPIISGGSARQYGITSNYTGTILANLAVTACTIAGIRILKADCNLSYITSYLNVHNIYITVAGGGTLRECTFSSAQGGHNYLIGDTTGSVTLINCIADTTTGAGVGFAVSNATGAIEFYSCIARNCGATGNGFSIAGGPNVKYYNCLSYSNGKSGFYLVDSAANNTVATLYNCYAYSNGEDGLSTVGGSGGHTSTVSCWYCKAYLNGTAGSATAGDGFTAHIGCVMNLYYCIGNKNFKAGAAMTQASSGVIDGCSFYDNYEASEATNCGIWMNATGTWVIKNNAIKHHTYEIEVTAAAIAGGLNLTVDYNCYHDSRGGNAFNYNGVALNWAGWLAACSQDTHSINVDPLFTDPVNSDFTLQVSSPCIDAGADLGAGYDYALDPSSTWPSGVVTRQQNATWDIGAYGGY